MTMISRSGERARGTPTLGTRSRVLSGPRRRSRWPAVGVHVPGAVRVLLHYTALVGFRYHFLYRPGCDVKWEAVDLRTIPGEPGLHGLANTGDLGTMNIKLY